MKFEISAACEKGLRPYLEDRYLVCTTEEGYLLSVFDGHGGDDAASHCQSRISEIYHRVRNNLLVCSFEILVPTIFQILNAETKHFDSGTTASIVFIPNNGQEVVVGVLGDSPVLVRKDTEELWHSPEHNVRSNPTEVDAAQKRGGMVYGGYLYDFSSELGLQLSRAFGDRDFDRVLSREPEIFRIKTNESSFVLVASDGLFDPSHAVDTSDQIVDDILGGASANDLVAKAIALPTGDNVTAILVRFSS